MSNRFHRERAEKLRQRVAELKTAGDDESLEHAADLEIEADEIDHYVGLSEIEDAREAA